MALANFVIIEVVSWGDFYAAGAFFHVGVFVSNDGNQSAYQGQNYVLTNQVGVSWVFWIHGNAGIAQ